MTKIVDDIVSIAKRMKEIEAESRSTPPPSDAPITRGGVCDACHGKGRFVIPEHYNSANGVQTVCQTCNGTGWLGR